MGLNRGMQISLSMPFCHQIRRFANTFVQLVNVHAAVNFTQNNSKEGNTLNNSFLKRSFVGKKK